mgnify:CR=1 FL=1
MTVEMPDIYAQLRLPGTELAARAYRLSHHSTPEFVLTTACAATCSPKR